jgi:hypothetical protein
MNVATLLKKVVAEALENVKPVDLQPVEAPKVSPEGEVVFSPELDAKILLTYADQIIQCPNFELFLKLLEQIVNENGLVPTTDTPKVAGLVNQLRVQKGLDPL